MSVTSSSLLISNPNMRALPFISKPRSLISGSIASILPIGTNTVFSMLQQSPESVPNFSKTSFTLFRVRGHSFMMMVASSAMAAALGWRVLTSGGRLQGRAGSAAGESIIPSICKSNWSLKSNIWYPSRNKKGLKMSPWAFPRCSLKTFVALLFSRIIVANLSVLSSFNHFLKFGPKLKKPSTLSRYSCPIQSKAFRISSDSSAPFFWLILQLLMPSIISIRTSWQRLVHEYPFCALGVSLSITLFNLVPIALEIIL